MTFEFASGFSRILTPSSAITLTIWSGCPVDATGDTAGAGEEDTGVPAGRGAAGAASVPEGGEPDTGVGMSGEVAEPAADGVPPVAFAEDAVRSRAISVSSTPRVAVAASPATADPDGVVPLPEPR